MDYLTDADLEIAEKNGIKKGTANYRFYYLKWSKHDSITKKPLKKNEDWEKYKKTSLVSRSTFFYRINQGMEPEQAAHTKPMVNQYG